MNAPREAKPDAVVTIEWKGPNNPGDYLTIVPKAAKDGVSNRVAYTSRGSPAEVRTPKEAGPCEVRYMSGQKNLVLARIAIDVR
jgi:Ca-activated chloride channel family protein